MLTRKRWICKIKLGLNTQQNRGREQHTINFIYIVQTLRNLRNRLLLLLKLVRNRLLLLLKLVRNRLLKLVRNRLLLLLKLVLTVLKRLLLLLKLVRNASCCC